MTMKLSRAIAIALPASSRALHSSAFVHPSRASARVFRRNMSGETTQTPDGAAKNLVVDPFCFRQFAESDKSEGYAGTVFNISIEQFEAIVNSRYRASDLKDGYAPFCKHLFLENDFTDARVNVLPITPENEPCLRTRYEARNEKELPVLARYFDRESLLKGKKEEDVFPVAKYVDLILYSREQIEKENAAMGKGEPVEKETAPWGIVSIKAQDVDRELPMTPITAMRNALGKDQGGSGVELVREDYMEAVNYWKDHANVL
ncbi:hypothetical protein ACHAWF_017464 [Thalassiosira exigua]